MNSRNNDVIATTLLTYSLINTGVVRYVPAFCICVARLDSSDPLQMTLLSQAWYLGIVAIFHFREYFAGRTFGDREWYFADSCPCCDLFTWPNGRLFDKIAKFRKINYTLRLRVVRKALALTCGFRTCKPSTVVFKQRKIILQDYGLTPVAF